MNRSLPMYAVVLGALGLFGSACAKEPTTKAESMVPPPSTSTESATKAAPSATLKEGFLPTDFRVYVGGGAVVNHPTDGFTERVLPTVNDYQGADGCYVACYTHDQA